MVQWLRARFNECYEKAEWAKARCAEELPFIDRLLHDKAKEIVSCPIPPWRVMTCVLSRMRG